MGDHTPGGLFVLRRTGTKTVCLLRGHSWRTLQRCRKELHISTLFAQNMYWWVLPSHTGLVGPGAFTPAEPALGVQHEPVIEDIEQVLKDRLHLEAQRCQKSNMPIESIKVELHNIAYRELITSLPAIKVDHLIEKIAEKYPPPSKFHSGTSPMQLDNFERRYRRA